MKVSHGLVLGFALGFGACYLWGRYKARQG